MANIIIHLELCFWQSGESESNITFFSVFGLFLVQWETSVLQLLKAPLCSPVAYCVWLPFGPEHVVYSKFFEFFH